MEKKRKHKKKPLLTALCIVFFLLSLLCIFGAHYISLMLDSQYEYKRWRGEGELDFSQISCFLPSDGKISVKDVYAFRTDMMNAFAEASIDTSDGNRFIDCWSTVGSTKIYGERNDGTASVTAVGGAFFSFHPLKLVGGNYLFEGDLMQDNILLDEDLAWLLFGGNNLEGMTVHMYGVPFRIAGVVARESDHASKKAYTGGLGLYMSYDAYVDLNSAQESDEEQNTAPDTGISCYEVCIPNPVKGFAKNLADTKFPIGTGEIVENSGRFDFWKVMGIAKNFAARSIQSGVPYPYWENAARYVETEKAILLCLAIIFALLPEFSFLFYLFLNMRWTRQMLEEEYFPVWAENAEEAIRVVERRRWEKKHNYTEKH